MTFSAVRCPHCQSDQSVNRGKTARGTPRYLCQNPRCAKGSCRRDSCHRRCLPEVKHLIIDRSRNASGVRAPARSLPICPNTVLRELRKQATALASVPTPVLRTLHPAEVAWDRERAGEAEMDAMWSFVGNKGNPRWLWHAIDHHTDVLRFVDPTTGQQLLSYREAEQARQEAEEHARREAAARAEAEARLAAVEAQLQALREQGEEL